MSESVDHLLARLFPVRGGPYCPQGHLFDEANTKYTATGARYCAACKRAKRLERYHAEKGHEPVPQDGQYRYRSWRRM
jgi:hypothetical protein